MLALDKYASTQSTRWRVRGTQLALNLEVSDHTSVRNEPTRRHRSDKLNLLLINYEIKMGKWCDTTAYYRHALFDSTQRDCPSVHRLRIGKRLLKHLAHKLNKSFAIVTQDDTVYYIFFPIFCRLLSAYNSN